MSIEKYKNLKIVAFVGLPGAGKSSAVDYLKAKGYPHVYFGGVILGAMEDADIAITPDNEKLFREEIREKEGKDFVVKRVVQQLHDLAEAGQHRIIADGLYTWTEYKILKREFPGELQLIAVVAPKHLRHHRLTTREHRPLTIDEAAKRDWAEIENLEKGGPIAIADHYVINDGNLDDLHTRIDHELASIEFYN